MKSEMQKLRFYLVGQLNKEVFGQVQTILVLPTVAMDTEILHPINLINFDEMNIHFDEVIMMIKGKKIVLIKIRQYRSNCRGNHRL